MTRIDNSQGYKLRPPNMVGDVSLFAGDSTQLNKKYRQGWRIADGTDGAPNLMDSFPKMGTFAQKSGTGGAKNITPAGGVSVNTSVNVLNHTLSWSEMPSHNHDVPTVDSSDYGSGTVGFNPSNNYSDANLNTSSAGSSQSHDHDSSASSSGSFSGSNHTNEPQFTYLVPLYFTGVAGSYL